MNYDIGIERLAFNTSFGRLVGIRIHTPFKGITGQMFWATGLGGDQNDYSPLAEEYAKAGVQFIQCDFSDSREDGETGRWTPDDFDWETRAVEFAEMIEFVRNHLNSQDLPYAVGGHSFGANTALNRYNAIFYTKDGRVLQNKTDAKVCILLSPQGQDVMTTNATWSRLQGPMLVGTGTEDDGRPGRNSNPNQQDYTWRLEPFLLSSNEALVYVIEGGDHSHGAITEGKTKYPQHPNTVSTQILPLIVNYTLHHLTGDWWAGLRVRLDVLKARWLRAGSIWQTLSWRR